MLPPNIRINRYSKPQTEQQEKQGKKHCQGAKIQAHADFPSLPSISLLHRLLKKNTVKWWYYSLMF